MTKRTHLALRAGSAIAAALALGSTPLLAQDAAAPPVVAAPPVATPPVTTSAPAPVPQPIPEPAPVMTSNPVVQEVPPEIVVPDVPEQGAPEPAAEEAAPVRQASPEPREARTATPVDRADPVASAEVTTPDATIAPPVAVAPVTPEAAPLPAADTAEPANDASLGILAALLGAIAVVALAIWGFVAIGRRRPRTVAPVVERPVVAGREPEPAVAPPLAETTVTPLASPRLHTADSDSLAHSGASIALPSKMPETFDERDALLKRMIAAKPDRANPFKSPLQRRHRAKLILQSLGRDFGDAEPWIDLSQYPSNWPSVARRTSAAA